MALVPFSGELDGEASALVPFTGELDDPANPPGLVGRLKQGINSTLNYGRINLTDNPDEIAGYVADTERKRPSATPAQQKMQEEIQPYAQQAKDAEGFVPNVAAYGKLAAKRAGQLVSNPSEFAGMVAENLPNSVPGIAAGLAGGAVGGMTPVPGGALIGGLVGGTAGGYQVEQGSSMHDQIVKEAQARGVPLTDEKALSAIIAEKYPEFLQASRLKGVGTAGTDAAINALTLGVAGAGERAIAKEAQGLAALAKTGGISATDYATQVAALEAKNAARNTLGQKALRGTGVTLGEMGGESVSEGVGQQLAYGQLDPLDVVDEGLLAVGQGAATAGARKVISPILGIGEKGGAEAAIEQAKNTVPAIPDPSTGGTFTPDPNGGVLERGLSAMATAKADVDALAPRAIDTIDRGLELVAPPTAPGFIPESELPIIGQPAPEIDAQPIDTGDTANQNDKTLREYFQAQRTAAAADKSGAVIPDAVREVAETRPQIPDVRVPVETQNTKVAPEANNGPVRRVDMALPPAVTQQQLADQEANRSTPRASEQLFTEDAPVSPDQPTQAPAAAGAPSIGTTNGTTTTKTQQAEAQGQAKQPTANVTADNISTADESVNTPIDGAKGTGTKTVQSVTAAVEPAPVARPAALPNHPAAKVVAKALPEAKDVQIHSTDSLSSEKESGTTGRMSKWRGKTIERLAKVFGRKRVVFFSSANMTADGMNIGGGDTLYVNIDSGIDPIAVVGHEWRHALKTSNAAAHDAINQTATKLLDQPGRLLEFAKAYYGAELEQENGGSQETKDRMARIESGEATDEDKAFLAEEFSADMTGNLWRDPKALKEVFDTILDQHPPSAARTIIKSIGDAIIKLIDKLIISTPKGQYSEMGISREELLGLKKEIQAAMADSFKQDVQRRLDKVRAGRGEVKLASPRADFTNQTLPTRWPTSKKLDPAPTVKDDMITDLATLKRDPVQYEKAVSAVLQDPGMRSPEMAKGTVDEKAEKIIERMKENLLWLHDQIPEAIRERSKLWYDGARKIAEAWADRYEISESQAAGALAVLSPQKDWFMNVTMAERVLDIIHTKMDHKFDKRMDAAAFGFLTKESVKTDPESQKNLKAYVAVKGKTLKQVAAHHDLRQMSVWIRAYDEAYHDAKHAIVTPEGGFVEDKTTRGGDATLRAWGDFNTPGKAASIYLDGTPENINKMLGAEHKVRNFYNNIYAPKDPRFLTADTHAVAANELRPLAGADKPVVENFGKTGGTNLTGLSGTYALHYEAYRRAAEARGLLPREMQSITWEAVRGLFTEGYKGKKENIAAIDKIWGQVDDGELSVDDARQRIIGHASGIENPDWWNEGNAQYKEVLRDKTYDPRRSNFAGAKVTFEVAPDPRNKALKARWDVLPGSDKAEISHKVAWKIAAKALAQFGDENMKGELHEQLGGWLADTNPSLSIWFNKRAAATKINELARILGYALNQMGMMRTSHRPFKTTSGAKAQQFGAVRVYLPSDFSAEQTQALYTEIRTITGKRNKPFVSGHTTADGVMIILNNEAWSGISNEDLTQRIGDRLFGRFDVDLATIYADFPEKGKDNYGLRTQKRGLEGVREEPSESSLRARSDQLRLESGVLLDQLIGEVEQRGIKLSPARSDGAGSGSLREAGPRVSYGRKQEGASQVEGLHFSQEKRDALDSTRYGQGLPGAEGQRLGRDSATPEQKQRIHFYVNEGKGVTAESGVGYQAHAVKLNNLYDWKADTLGLFDEAIQKFNSYDDQVNYVEQQAMARGFDGVYARGAQGDQGVAVLLGPHTVPVDYLGMGKKTTEVAPPMAPKSEGKQAFEKLQQSVMANKSLPGGEMTGADWKRLMPKLMPEIDVSHLLDGQKYYKDQIVERQAKFSPRRDETPYGRAISKTLLSNRGYSILTESEAQSGPFDGGCLIAAKAIMRAMGDRGLAKQRGLVRLVSDVDGGQTEHYAAKVDGIIYDASGGFTTGRAWADYFSKEERLTRAVQVDEGYDENSDIPDDPVAEKKLARLLAAKLSPARAQTETPEFKRWFGDSKVVDAEGKPLVVYHGTNGDFVRFNNTDLGIFFTGDTNAAQAYAMGWEGSEEDPMGSIFPVYLSLKNPLVTTRAFLNNFVKTHKVEIQESRVLEFSDMTFQEAFEDSVTTARDLVTKYARNSGYDGMILPYDASPVESLGGDWRQGKSYVVFSPNQIKSAIGNSGQFDAKNPDIRFSPPRFFSQLATSIDQVPKKMETMPAAQWRMWLTGNAPKLGIKKDEIVWSGIEDYLEMRGKEKVTKAEVQQFLSENGTQVNDVVLGSPKTAKLEDVLYFQDLTQAEWDAADETQRNEWREEYASQSSMNPLETKFGQYVVPGGENYRELLITLPGKSELNVVPHPTKGGFAIQYGNGAYVTSPDGGATTAQTFDPDKASQWDKKEYISAGLRSHDKAQFYSSHFDQPNILAHLRMDERTDAQGDKVLFLEELQSDFGQQGEKLGFVGQKPDDESKLVELKAKLANETDADKRAALGKSIAKIDKRISGDDYSVPQAPIVTDTKSWVALGLKRAIMYAVQNGMSKVAWASGEQNAAHYDLSKQVDRIYYYPVGDKYHISVMGKEGQDLHRGTHTVSELEDVVGKDVTEKIVKGEGPKDDDSFVRTLSGLDLKVGGEGMRAFYDQIVPQVANDVLKKLGGGKVETIEIDARSPEDNSYYETPKDSDFMPQQGFTIPPSMAEKVQTDGVPLFSPPRYEVKRDEEDEGTFAVALSNDQKNRNGDPLQVAHLHVPDEAVSAAGWRIGDIQVTKALRRQGIAAELVRRMSKHLGSKPIGAASVFSEDGKKFFENAKFSPARGGLASGQKDIYAEGYEVPNQQPKPSAIDGPRLTELRRAAARLESTKKGIFLRVEADGRAIASGPKGTRIPEIFRRFANDNSLEFYAERRIPKPPNAALGEGFNVSNAPIDITRKSQPMPLLYRESGAHYFGEDVGQSLDRTAGTRFSTPRGAITNQPINQAWQDPDNLGKWDDFVRTMQDKLVDTKRVISAIRAAGVAIKDTIDPYLQEVLYHGRSAKRVTDFADNELRPLLVEMGMRKIERQELEDYLWARHATERNAQIAKINPKMQDGGSGLTNQQAADIMSGQTVNIGGRDIKLNLRQMPGYRSLAAKIDAITKETTDTLVRYGLETQDTVDAWRNTYGKYVPLMRDMEADDNYAGAFNLGLGTGQGFSVRGSASKRALGSERGVIDILANVAMQRERAIVRGEKNRVAQSMYGLAITAPNPDFWLPLNPDAKKSPAQVTAELVALGLNPIDAANIANEPKQRYTDPNTGMVMERVNPQLRSRGDVLAVRINGKDRYVMFSSNERAQKMVAGLKNLDVDQLGMVMQKMAVVTRWFAAINTQYNPVFGMTNGIRDLGTGMLNLESTELKGQQAEVLKNAISALRGVYSDLRDHRAGRTPTSRWALEYEEYALEGGQTGYRDMFQTSRDRTEGLMQELKDATKGKTLLTFSEKRSPLFGWLSDYNTSIENAIRLSAYKAAKDKGMTKAQAASLAKNLTVNFNKKGLAATQLGAMYAFFNAAAQGTARIGQTLVKVDNGKFSLTGAGKKIVYGGMMAGVLQAAMFAAAGWDDEEPPQFIREKNFIIPLPEGKYLSVPYPLGFHVIPNIGRVASEFVLGGFKNPGKRLVDMFSMIMDGFNPIGGSSGGVSQMLSPTVTDPLVALSENKDWTGKSIYKEDFNSMHPTAGWTRKKDTASNLSRWLAYGINYLTGGGKYEIGLLSPTPDQLDYLIGQGTGGVGRESLKAWQFGATAATGENMPMYKVPIAGRFVGETTGQASETSKFYNNLKRIGEHKAALDEMQKARDLSAMIEYRKENPDAALVKQADKASTDISELKRRKRELLEKGSSPEQIKLMEAVITTRVKRYNEMLSARS
jgi:hypothetical protein